jgi:two-component system response regulator
MRRVASINVCHLKSVEALGAKRVNIKGVQHKTPNAGIKAEFAKAVRQRRERLGISQEKLAEKAGLHRTYVSDIERGARNLSLESINRLARALEVSVSALFPPTPFDVEASAGKSVVHNNHSELVDILLVEDNPDDMELTIEAFKQARFSNRVTLVETGEQALDYVFRRGDYSHLQDKDAPKLILLDLNLPGMHGLEVLRRIKHNKDTKPIPVVVLTASQHDRDIAESHRLGAATYLVKPVDFQRLSSVTPQLNLNWALLGPALRAQV